MLSLLVHARVSYTTILESFLTSLLPKTRTKVSQTAHRLLSGSLNRPLRTLSCFASRFFCIVALQLISPSVRCPYANALSLIHPAFQVPYGGEPAVGCASQWAILALLLEEPSVQGRVSSGFAGEGKSERKKLRTKAEKTQKKRRLNSAARKSIVRAMAIPSQRGAFWYGQ